ncbi:MAG: hypothetical protein FJ222_02680 [Lentisphaerae bacterium]|nr:hypothetical protein [Lentisphaerota bacterium]
MQAKLKHLPMPVVRTILAFYRRKRVYELMRALLVPLLVYAVLAVIATHLDRFLFLDTPERVWISGVTHGMTLLAGVMALGTFAWRRFSVGGLAYEMERLLPASTAERLVTLNDVLAGAGAGAGPNSAARVALVEQLTRETVALCERTPHAARLARDRRLKRRTGALALLAVAWVGLFAMPSYQFSLMLQRLAQPTRNLPKPSFMRLTVTPEAAMVGRGGEVVLQVQVTGEIPRLLQRPLRWLGADAGVCLLASATGFVSRLPVADDARPMSRVQRRLFVTTRNDLQESFSYRVRCGDAQTDIRRVRVIAQPRATGVTVAVEPPAYTGIPTARVEDLRDPIPAFAGSRVRIEFASDQSPLKSARLIGVPDGAALAELRPDPTTGAYRYEFVMADAVEMEVVLVNDLGFENTERVRLCLTLREDQAPSVRLDYPAGDLTVAQGELVSMHMELADDLGLLEGAICYQINPGRNQEAPDREIPLPVQEKSLAQTVSANFDLAKVDAVPGDQILLAVRVRDTGRRDERSQSVRILVSALAGNENERRRVAALRLIAQILAIMEPAASDPTALALNEAAYEPIAASAKAQGLALNSRPALDSLLDFIESEHHFTDGADGADEARMLYAVISGLFYKPPMPSPHSLEARQAALRQLTTEMMPALLRERWARDLIRRAFNLRGETLGAAGLADAAARASPASRERRVDLLLEALDTTGADLAALARMSPQIDLDKLLACTRQISRSGRDLRHADPALQQAAGKTMAEQIDGWIGLLLPPLPEWKTQRLAARDALRVRYNQRREELSRSGSAAPHASSVELARWGSADARMVERSAFLGLGERLAVVAPGRAAGGASPDTGAALACEAEGLARAALDNEYADWMNAARVTPAERRLADALKALDLARDAAERAAAAERVRTLDVDGRSEAENETGLPPLPAGLNAALPGLTRAVAAIREPVDTALDTLAGRSARLLDGLTGLAPSSDGGGMPAMTPVLAALEAGLTEWEADALRLAYRMHLDLAYSDPGQETNDRLAAALAGLRAALNRYRVFVPPLLSRIRARTGSAPRAEVAATVTLDLEELSRSVKALGIGLARAAKLLRGEESAGNESAAVRELRRYYVAARKLAEAKDPGAVAEAFFADNPAAAALVIQTRLPLIHDLRNRLREAGGALQGGTAASAEFREAMSQAARLTGDFLQVLERFKALDANGSVSALAGEIRTRALTLASPDRPAGADTLSRDKLALDELSRQAEQVESQARELVLKRAPITPSGWWGAPAGVWDGVGRRDAEHARRRIMAQFDRARRDAVQGFDAVLARRGSPGAVLPDAPLAGSLFAWRTLHSSLGGETFTPPPPPPPPPRDEQLVRYLLDELDKTSKALRRAGGARRYQEPTLRWVDSAAGYLRH